MGFYDASINGLRNFCVIKGRASRSEFWWFKLLLLAFIVAEMILFVMFVCLLNKPMLLGYFLRAPQMTSISTVFTNFRFFNGIMLLVIAPIYLIICNFCLQIRRLHDINKSGWWLLIQLFPYLGPILLLYWFCKRSDVSANDYGPNPNQL